MRDRNEKQSSRNNWHKLIEICNNIHFGLKTTSHALYMREHTGTKDELYQTNVKNQVSFTYPHSSTCCIDY